jgi:proline dehydrogenase
MHVLRSIEAGQKEGFSVGIKLVRGAYHSQEMSNNSPYEPDVDSINRYMEKLPTGFPAHANQPTPPVWTEKQDTDAGYNAVGSKSGIHFVLLTALSRLQEFSSTMLASLIHP